jgi:hypothetical protein
MYRNQFDFKRVRGSVWIGEVEGALTGVEVHVRRLTRWEPAARSIRPATPPSGLRTGITRRP